MKRIPRNRWVTIAVIVLAVGAVTAWYFTPASAGQDDAIVARVKNGDFKVVVTSAGELRAKKFVQVQGPLNMQQAEVYQTKIASLVPEGTVVKEGDVVPVVQDAEYVVKKPATDPVPSQAIIDIRELMIRTKTDERAFLTELCRVDSADRLTFDQQEKVRLLLLEKAKAMPKG